MLILLVGSGFAFANLEIKSKNTKKAMPKPPTAEEKKAILKKWEATPEGKAFKAWEVSPAGKKVYASEAKIRKSISNYSVMNAEVTSLTLPPGSRLGFGLMVKINNEDYILSVGPDQTANNNFQQLRTLKVNDKIQIRSRNVSHAPKYAYPIIAGDYIEKDQKVVFQKVQSKGC